MNKFDVLREAADDLERNGWCQGIAENDAGEHCASGAIVTADRFSNTLAWLAQRVLVEYLYPGFPISSILAWNDMPERTAAEVITAMREAADWGEKQAAERGEL